MAKGRKVVEIREIAENIASGSFGSNMKGSVSSCQLELPSKEEMQRFLEEKRREMEG